MKTTLCSFGKLLVLLIIFVVGLLSATAVTSTHTTGEEFDDYSSTPPSIMWTTASTSTKDQRQQHQIFKKDRDSVVAALLRATKRQPARDLKPKYEVGDIKEDNNQDHNIQQQQQKANSETISALTSTVKASPTSQETETRIVGGVESSVGQFPYFVHLFPNAGCGASLISPRVVLSAAHCDVEGFNLIGNTVSVGRYAANELGTNVGDTTGGLTVSVTDQVNHPQYTVNTEANDLVLLLLSVPVDIQEPTLTISTDSNYYSPPGDLDLTVIGLGLLESDGAQPDFLRHVVVPSINPDTCDELYRLGGNPNFDGNIMMCAGDTSQGGIDSCQGDSGGPIVDASSNRQHIQYGVVSWGIGCARPEFPGVYAKTGSNIDWIRTVVCDQWQVEADFCPADFATEAPTRAPTQRCNNESPILIDWRFHTDDYGSETSWDLKDNDGFTLDGFEGSENTYDNDTPYRFQMCVECDARFTLTIYDQFSDGLCCGGNPSYNLVVNGNVIVDVKVGDPEINFGDSRSWEISTMNACDAQVEPDTSSPTEAPVLQPQPTNFPDTRTPVFTSSPTTMYPTTQVPDTQAPSITRAPVTTSSPTRIIPATGTPSTTTTSPIDTTRAPQLTSMPSPTTSIDPSDSKSVTVGEINGDGISWTWTLLSGSPCLLNGNGVNAFETPTVIAFTATSNQPYTYQLTVDFGEFTLTQDYVLGPNGSTTFPYMYQQPGMYTHEFTTKVLETERSGSITFDNNPWKIMDDGSCVPGLTSSPTTSEPSAPPSNLLQVPSSEGPVGSPTTVAPSTTDTPTDSPPTNKPSSVEESDASPTKTLPPTSTPAPLPGITQAPVDTSPPSLGEGEDEEEEKNNSALVYGLSLGALLVGGSMFLAFTYGFLAGPKPAPKTATDPGTDTSTSEEQLNNESSEEDGREDYLNA